MAKAVPNNGDTSHVSDEALEAAAESTGKCTVAQLRSLYGQLEDLRVMTVREIARVAITRESEITDEHRDTLNAIMATTDIVIAHCLLETNADLREETAAVDETQVNSDTLLAKFRGLNLTAEVRACLYHFLFVDNKIRPSKEHHLYGVRVLEWHAVACEALPACNCKLDGERFLHSMLRFRYQENEKQPAEHAEDLSRIVSAVQVAFLPPDEEVGLKPEDYVSAVYLLYAAMDCDIVALANLILPQCELMKDQRRDHVLQSATSRDTNPAMFFQYALQYIGTFADITAELIEDDPDKGENTVKRSQGVLARVLVKAASCPPASLRAASDNNFHTLTSEILSEEGDPWLATSLDSTMYDNTKIGKLFSIEVPRMAVAGTLKTLRNAEALRHMGMQKLLVNAMEQKLSAKREAALTRLADTFLEELDLFYEDPTEADDSLLFGDAHEEQSEKTLADDHEDDADDADFLFAHLYGHGIDEDDYFANHAHRHDEEDLGAVPENPVWEEAPDEFKGESELETWLHESRGDDNIRRIGRAATLVAKIRFISTVDVSDANIPTDPYADIPMRDDPVRPDHVLLRLIDPETIVDNDDALNEFRKLIGRVRSKLDYDYSIRDMSADNEESSESKTKNDSGVADLSLQELIEEMNEILGKNLLKIAPDEAQAMSNRMEEIRQLMAQKMDSTTGPLETEDEVETLASLRKNTARLIDEIDKFDPTNKGMRYSILARSIQEVLHSGSPSLRKPLRKLKGRSIFDVLSDIAFDYLDETTLRHGPYHLRRRDRSYSECIVPMLETETLECAHPLNMDFDLAAVGPISRSRIVCAGEVGFEGQGSAYRRVEFQAAEAARRFFHAEPGTNVDFYTGAQVAFEQYLLQVHPRLRKADHAAIFDQQYGDMLKHFTKNREDGVRPIHTNLHDPGTGLSTPKPLEQLTADTLDTIDSKNTLLWLGSSTTRLGDAPAAHGEKRSSRLLADLVSNVREGLFGRCGLANQQDMFALLTLVKTYLNPRNDADEIQVIEELHGRMGASRYIPRKGDAKLLKAMMLHAAKKVERRRKAGDAQKARKLYELCDTIGDQIPYVPFVLDLAQAVGRTTPDLMNVIKPDVWLFTANKALGCGQIGGIGFSPEYEEWLEAHDISIEQTIPTMHAGSLGAVGMTLNGMLGKNDYWRLEGNFGENRNRSLNVKIANHMTELTQHARKRAEEFASHFVEGEIKFPSLIKKLRGFNSVNDVDDWNDIFRCQFVYPAHRRQRDYAGIVTLHFCNMSGSQLKQRLAERGYNVGTCLQDDRGIRLSFHYLHEKEDIDDLFRAIQSIVSAHLEELATSDSEVRYQPDPLAPSTRRHSKKSSRRRKSS